MEIHPSNLEIVSMMFVRRKGLLILIQIFHLSTSQKPKLTFDEFFNHVEYPKIDVSPSGQHLFIEVFESSWETNSYKDSLWIYDIQANETWLITDKHNSVFTPKWSPSGTWLAFSMDNQSHSLSLSNVSETKENYMYLCSVRTREIISLPIGSTSISSLDWSNNDHTLYFTSRRVRSNEEDEAYKSEWKHVINYRRPPSGTTIKRLDIDATGQMISGTVHIVTNVSFIVGELLYVPFEHQLVFNSKGILFEDVTDFEMYSIHLDNVTSSLRKLTDMEGIEQEMQLSSDGQHILFRLRAISSGAVKLTQRRIFSLDLTTGYIERLAKDFNGLITQFDVRAEGGVYFLGQLGLQVQMYTQDTSFNNVTYQYGWEGSYEQFSVSSTAMNSPVAFVFSSFNQPKEVYLANRIDQLNLARRLTNFNELFTQRSLPYSQGYRWINTNDQQEIEGVLHYPPGMNGTMNLPLLVLIHGGPNAASLNEFQANWYNWALMAALEGWLVLEPNYRGSTGYGDDFLEAIRSRLLSLPAQDIMMGVDQLIKEGIADPKKLAVGGYSYGGFLTNWLITKTTRFNAALSGAGDIEHVSGWGTMDLPVLIKYLHGGFPWEVATIYQTESPIYHLDRIRTPTHIVTGEVDVRVKADQSYILERGLHYLGIPTQLLIFPNEGHDLEKKPWSGKIKVREELKWLQKYGHQSWNGERGSSSASMHHWFVNASLLFLSVICLIFHIVN